MFERLGGFELLYKERARTGIELAFNLHGGLTCVKLSREVVRGASLAPIDACPVALPSPCVQAPVACAAAGGDGGRLGGALAARRGATRQGGSGGEENEVFAVSRDLPVVGHQENKHRRCQSNPCLASASFSLAPVLPYPSAKTLFQGNAFSKVVLSSAGNRRL